MVSRPVPDTIDILRRTLLEIERDLDPVSDASALETLKRIILNRIAELEIQAASQAQAAAPGPELSPAEVTQLAKSR
jgi:hypothetical protein